MSNFSRSEAVRKYFTKTPVAPDSPSYYDPEEYKVKLVLASLLILLALMLFLYVGNGLSVFLGLVAGYFSLRFSKSAFSNYSETKKRIKAEKKNYEKAYSEYKEAYKRAEPKPSDKQMDEWMNDDIEKVIDESLRRLDLEHEDYRAQPLLIGGPASLKETKYARGRDGKTRYSHFNILVVYLTDYHVAAYQSINSMEYGQILTDNTQEFPYREITNLGTQTVKEQIRLVDGVVASESGLQEFTLATSGSNFIRVAYAFARSTDSQGELLRIGEERTIAAIRKKLQDYKKKYEK